MKLVVTALFRAIYTQLHPRMLWLAVWPFLIGLLVWGGFGFYFREPILSSLHDVLFGLELTHWIEGMFRFFGIEGILIVIVPVLYGVMLLALAIVTALLIISMVAMPTVVDHIASRQFPQLERRVGGSWLGSIANAVIVSVLFVVGWILTLPLWLLLPLAVLLPWFWWAWLTARILRYDALLQHATGEERATLIDEHRIGFFVMGLLVAALNFLPPLFFIAPIFGGIAFTHYGLKALEELRAARAIAAPEAPVARKDAASNPSGDLVTPAGGAGSGPLSI